MLKNSISLVVPIYNEEEIIEDTINLFNKMLSNICTDFEIIAVNDGSTDKTQYILNSLKKEYPKLKIFHNEKNTGSGASLWRGFQEASKELIVSNFADRPFDISFLAEILEAVNLDIIDFIVIARKDRSANTFYRKITSLSNYFLIKILFKADISDFQFVQIYKKEILEGITIRSKETFVPPEIMIKLINKGHRYQEVSYPFHKRTSGKSKCGHPLKIIRSISEILKFWFRWKILKKMD